MQLLSNHKQGFLGIWDWDPGHWEPVLPKNRSADLFADLLGFLRRSGGGGGLTLQFACVGNFAGVAHGDLPL